MKPAFLLDGKALFINQDYGQVKVKIGRYLFCIKVKFFLRACNETDFFRFRDVFKNKV